MTRPSTIAETILAEAEIPGPATGLGWEDVLRRVPDTPHRRVRRRALAVGAIAVAGVAALGVGLMDPWGDSPTLIERASAAITPAPNKILHISYRSDGAPGGLITELWWRDSQNVRMVDVIGGRASEFALDGELNLHYDSESHTVTEASASARFCFGPVVATRADGSLDCSDPLSSVRAALDSGDAYVESAAQIDGRAAVRIRTRAPGDQALVTYVDASTYEPLRFESIVPGDPGATVTTDVVSFEWLPATDENERLLDPREQHPDARVIRK